jgi:hypothetical protein
MHAHLADAKHFQSSEHVQSMPVFTWLKQRFEARHQKQVAKRQIAYFGTLDHHFLEDMGVDMAALWEDHPSLARFAPPMSTASESKNFFHLPVNMSTR